MGSKLDEGDKVSLLETSNDPVERHAGFRETKNLPFPLLSEPTHEVIEHFVGSGLLSAGRAHRANFLIDGDGIVRYAHVEKLSVFHRSAQELLEVVKSLATA